MYHRKRSIPLLRSRIATWGKMACNFTAISEVPSKYGNSKGAFLFLIFRQSIKVAEEDCSGRGGNCVKHFISRLRKHNKDEKWEEEKKKREAGWSPIPHRVFPSLAVILLDQKYSKAIQPFRKKFYKSEEK